jgi:hypothetical protein
MRGLILALSLAVLLTGCASTTPPPAGGDSSLIVGRLKVEVRGMGIAINGTDGMLNTDQPTGSALVVYNETSGKTYKIYASDSEGLFMLPNAGPGPYRLIELWAQVKTENSYVTISSDFYKDFTFEVKPGSVTNLGVSIWKFSFDLTRSASVDGFVFNGDFPAVEKAFAHMDPHSRWTDRRIDQAAFTGDAATHTLAKALMPRTIFLTYSVP